eukprot:TRINITY_DN3462_c0_g1_i2.p1 TRINITY_DN3462_c0_g1~~TRINITY_DN3462_c0_g1_i2.p1  ORF type:complete len:418 (+),score=116.23 TRINITY_DN3462_c0_g1_i2:182-1435(+)
MNALQLSWIKGTSQFTEIITIRKSDEFIYQSENEMLGEWVSKLDDVLDSDVKAKVILLLKGHINLPSAISDILCQRLGEDAQIQMDILKTDLNKWVNLLKKAPRQDVSSHGAILHQAIEERCNSTNFEVLLDLDIVEGGTLEWKNPEKDNMNSLELSWTIDGAEKLAELLIIRLDDEIVFSCENEILGEYAERVNNTSEDDDDEQLKLCSELVVNECSDAILRICLSKIRIGCSLSKNRIPDLINVMCIILFYTNPLKFINNNMSLESGFKDNNWRGALMNVGINEGIAEWEFNVGPIPQDNLHHVSFGIMEKTSSPITSWFPANSNVICVKGNGYKRIRGPGSQYENGRLQSGSTPTIVLRLDMTKGELCMKVDGVDRGVITSGLSGSTWCPWFTVADCSGQNTVRFTLKDFKRLH